MQFSVSRQPLLLDSALPTLLTAIRGGDRPAQAASCIALMHAVRSLDGTCRRHGVPTADLDDVRQELLLKIVRSLQTLRGELRRPTAWVRRVARSVAVDWMRREGRARREDVDVDSIAAPLNEAKGETDRAAILDRAVAAYVARADRLPRGPRGHHVRAWYELRIRALPAPDVAEHLDPEESARPSTTLVWKWAERGQALVLRLAGSDEDAARAELVRRLLTSAAQCQRGEGATVSST